MKKVNHISTLLEKYRLENNLRVHPKKSYLQIVKKDKKTALLAKYKGCNEQLAEKAIKTKERINSLKESLSKQLGQHSQSFYDMARQQSLLDLRRLYYYQIKLLELQSKVKK
jgi:hypothetical protein